MIAFLGLMIVSCLEIVAQSYYFFVLKPSFDAQREDERHYYHKSENPILAYELQPGTYNDNNRTLSINAQGMRGGAVATVPSIKLGLLGDSVTFSTGHGDGHTISDLVQDTLNEICKNIEVLNFGVPGYAAREIHENFLMKAAPSGIDAAIYILNLNDFA